VNAKAIGAGAIFACTGILYGTIALSTLPIGEALEMGPGYFPVVISGLLSLFGLVSILRGVTAGTPVSIGAIPWRAMVVLTLAILIFSNSIRPLGLFISVFLSTFAASFAASGQKLLQSVAAAGVIALLCVAIFHFAIGLNLPVFGSWFHLAG
jgi:hypothetical protein